MGLPVALRAIEYRGERGQVRVTVCEPRRPRTLQSTCLPLQAHHAPLLDEALVLARIYTCPGRAQDWRASRFHAPSERCASAADGRGRGATACRRCHLGALAQAQAAGAKDGPSRSRRRAAGNEQQTNKHACAGTQGRETGDGAWGSGCVVLGGTTRRDSRWRSWEQNIQSYIDT